MGVLRAIFAISVIFAHSWPGGLMFVGGRNAVQLFYIISGFLISYVLIEKNSYKKISIFYVNRYLRLYPIYFVVAVLSLIFIFFTKQSAFLDVYKAAPVGANSILIFSNVFLLGQDWIMFSGVENNHLVWVSNFFNSDVVLYQGLVIPQAWTLGVELSFYAIAPFVLRKRTMMIALLFLSLMLRAYLVKLGLGTKDPWTYRFFPTELAFFLLGALAHQVLYPWYKKLKIEKLNILSSIATCFLILLSLTYFMLPVKEAYKSIFLFATFLMFIPLAFIFQTRYRFDSFIGNLSYPIYIGHLLVIWITSYLFESLGIVNPYYVSLCCVILTVIFAIFLDRFIGAPIENIRKNIKNGIESSSLQLSSSPMQ